MVNGRIAQTVRKDFFRYVHAALVDLKMLQFSVL